MTEAGGFESSEAIAHAQNMNRHGIALAQAGHFAEAEAWFQEAVRVWPEFRDGHNNLANILMFQGKFGDAVASYESALRLAPDNAAILNNMGHALWKQHKLAEAETCYRQSLRLNPDAAYVWSNLGMVLAERGQFADAIAAHERSLQLNPDDGSAYTKLGTALRELGKLDDALGKFAEALRRNPDDPEALNNQAIAFLDLGRREDAEANLRRATELRPDFADAWSNLGVVLREQMNLDGAIICLRKATELRPDYAQAWSNLGNVFRDQLRHEDAIACYVKALQFSPDNAEAHSNLGVALKEQGRVGEAAECFREAARLRPDFAEGHTNLASALAELGLIDEARASFNRALAIQPTDRLRITVGTLLPLVYESKDHLKTERQRFADNVRHLCEEGVLLDLTNQTALPTFYLTYQGQDNQGMLRDLRRLYAAPDEPAVWQGAGPAGRTIKVGFISAYFCEHTIGRLMTGLISHLSPERFSVAVFSCTKRPDDITTVVRENADVFFHVPDNLPAARRLLADQELDVLFYTDIGMDPFTYTLAFSRFAPVQCVTWGHPDTTALETIDYFISSDLFERSDSACDYTERLVRLKSLPAYAYRPAPSTPLRGRENYGFADDCRLYACLQSGFKFHPEFDELLGGILRRDLKAVIAVSEGSQPRWREPLLRRFKATLPDVVDRIRFMSWLNYSDFLNLNAVADVLLDTLHFGGGRTSYEALAFGQPIVTLPSAFLRGRMVYGMYQKMQVLDCVAKGPEEYIDIAVKLATEPDFRAVVRSKILATNDTLYEDEGVVRELESFFEEAVAAAYNGSR
jgi:predicted O-linked N-acetylglucosamine transferase (SPINDLY family)